MQEASTLKTLYDSLDDVMARADLPQMLSALRTIRSSLDALVSVPEFVGVQDKVAMLEARVKEVAVPKLAQAFADRRGAPPLPPRRSCGTALRPCSQGSAAPTVKARSAARSAACSAGCIPALAACSA
jgi:hypothetical protein